MIKLQTGESIVTEVQLHWVTYLFPGIWAFFGVLSAFQLQTIEGGFVIALIFGTPLLYRYLQNKCKTYVVTTNRVYVEEGIFAKSKKDIPLTKINDVEVTQSFIQRILYSGNIVILTGNDKATKLTDIEKSEELKNSITSIKKG